jgi:hypothetical protein
MYIIHECLQNKFLPLTNSPSTVSLTNEPEHRTITRCHRVEACKPDSSDRIVPNAWVLYPWYKHINLQIPWKLGTSCVTGINNIWTALQCIDAYSIFHHQEFHSSFTVLNKTKLRLENFSLHFTTLSISDVYTILYLEGFEILKNGVWGCTSLQISNMTICIYIHPTIRLVL